MNRARRNNVVYCDPPYVPLTESSNFTSYTKEDFDLGMQKQLSLKARDLSERGISVLVSHHENNLTREMYRGAKISRFPVRRMISCKGDNRNEVVELLALFEARA
jgi:DNA adenine methylase